MKAQLIAVIAICICITSALFIDPVNSTASTTATIQTSGFINYETDTASNKPQVIVRHLGNPMPDWTQNIEKNVDLWVRNNIWVKGGAVILDMEDIAPILWFNQPGYKGYVFNTTYGVWSSTGWTFTQLEQLINRFHYNNVSVILGIIGFAKTPESSCWTSNIWDWMYSINPELFYTQYYNGVTSYLGVNGGTYSYPTPINFFANFTTDDLASGAKRGERLVTLFDTRLSEMVSAGLRWDGLFGSEGWGSVGSWGQTIDASTQLTTEYSEWTKLQLPLSWADMTGRERFSWIQQNNVYQNDFEGWAGYMFASTLFKPVHDTIQNLRQSSGFFIGLLFSPDQTWQDGTRTSQWGGWSQNVGYNATYLAQYCSDPTYIYWVDQEGTDWSQSMAQQEAYTAAIVKSSGIHLNVVLGLHTLNNNGPSAPISWLYKEYLAQACDYVWVNGQRYQAVNSKIIVIQYPDNRTNQGYFNSDINDLFEWINNIMPILSSAIALNIGPTYVVTSTQKTYGDQSWSNFNYTFLQWTTTNNLSNHPENLDVQMNALFLPEREMQERGDQLLNIQDTILKMFANGSLSIIVNSESVYSDAGILQGYLFSGSSTIDPLATFHVSGPSSWTTDINNQVLSQSDQYANWIIGNYAGNKYSPAINKWYSPTYAYNLRGYYPSTGFLEIARLQSGLIQFGIYYNASSGNFAYLQYQQALPADMVNRGIQWAVKEPIKSSNALIETATYITPQGIAIPIWNMQNDKTITVSLTIDATELNIDSVSNYLFSWASNPAMSWTESSWDNISDLVLNNGADILMVNKQ